MDKTALYNLSYGVYILTSWGSGKPRGCTVNSAIQITSSPERIAVSVNNNNFTCKCIKDTGVFCLNVLGESIDPIIIGNFGYRSSKDFDKFEDIDFLVEGNVPVLPQAMSYISCNVIDSIDAGTHTIFLGEVTEAGNIREDTPMTYDYYHKVIKGSAPKNAPTYRGE